MIAAGLVIVCAAAIAVCLITTGPETPSGQAKRLYERTARDRTISDREYRELTRALRDATDELAVSGNCFTMPQGIVVLAEPAGMDSFQVNTYWPSIDYRTGLALRVITVEKGRFPHSHVGICCHSGVLLGAQMGAWEGQPVRLALLWDSETNLYQLIDFKPAEYPEGGESNQEPSEDR